MSKVKAIIVKKVNKKVAGGHHGGAWKVAYADFVTAMMAFFLLMWLLNMTSDEKRARLSQYFKYFSIYDQGGTSFMEKSSEIFAESGESSQKALKGMGETNIKDTEKELKKGIMGKMQDAKDQVLIDTMDEGVRIQMIDKDGSPMFESGSNKLTPKAKQILHVIGENINKLPNKVSIEGHTDAMQYAKSDYSNWELSTERASSARKELEANGLDAKRIDRVSGYADKDPLIKDDPQDPRNRRISIILKDPYVDETKSPVKTDPLKSSESLPENKDESNTGVILNKFEENLSLIKSGMNAAEKKKEASAANEKSGTTPVETKEFVGPEKKDWGAVIKKDEWSPVIKDALSPVIKNDTAVKNYNFIPVQRPDNSKPVLKNIQIPAVTKDTSKPVTREIEKSTYDYLIKSSKTKKAENSSVVKNEPVPALNEQNKDAEKKPSVIKELSVPVISTDELFKK
jgi:chemotaxis protein MotB